MRESEIVHETGVTLHSFWKMVDRLKTAGLKDGEELTCEAQTLMYLMKLRQNDSNSLLYCDFFPSVGAWVNVGHSLKSTIVFNFCAKNRLDLCCNQCRRETVAEFGSQQRSSHNKTSSTHVRQLIIKILLQIATGANCKILKPRLVKFS